MPQKQPFKSGHTILYFSACGGWCTLEAQFPLCGSDGKTYEGKCDLKGAQCKDPTLEEAHEGPC